MAPKLNRKISKIDTLTHVHIRFIAYTHKIQNLSIFINILLSVHDCMWKSTKVLKTQITLILFKLLYY